MGLFLTAVTVASRHNRHRKKSGEAVATVPQGSVAQPVSSMNFASIEKVSVQRHGGSFENARGKVEHKGEECLAGCAGTAACPGFCGAGGACCRLGFGLDDEACEYGKAGGSAAQHQCTRRRVPLASSSAAAALEAVSGSSSSSLSAFGRDAGTDSSEGSLRAERARERQKSRRQERKVTARAGETDSVENLLSGVDVAATNDRRHSSHKNKEPAPAVDFGSVGKVSAQLHGKGALFELAKGKVEHKGEECSRACFPLAAASSEGSGPASSDGSGACPGFCGAAGACCRHGFGLNSEACEHGKAGDSKQQQHECVRRRVAVPSSSSSSSFSSSLASSSLLPPPELPVASDTNAASLARRIANRQRKVGGGSSVDDPPLWAPNADPRVWIPTRGSGGGGDGLLRSVPAESAVPESVKRGGVFNHSVEDAGRDRMGRWHAQAGQVGSLGEPSGR